MDEFETLRRVVRACTLILFATGCATSGTSAGKSRPDLTISIGEENVRVGERTFAIGDAEAMRAGFAGACDNGCAVVEIRAIPMARYDALLASYDAGIENSAGAIALRIAASPAVSLATGPAGAASTACSAEVVLRHHAIDVYIDGELLPPDGACEEWSSTVCDSKSRDPMKRKEFEALAEIVRNYRPRFSTHACLYVESEMPAMLLDRLIQTVHAEAGPTSSFSLRRDRRAGRLREEAVTEAIIAQGPALTACYDVELNESKTPMEAVVRLLIGPSGTVLRVALHQQSRTTPRFEACLETAIKGFAFPRPEHGGAVEINYPLRFSPRPL